MMIGLAIGWVLGIGTAILLLEFAAAALADELRLGLDPEDRPAAAEALTDR
jgi:hypothetical protein